MITKEAFIYEKRTTIRHPEVLIGSLCLDLQDRQRKNGENTHFRFGVNNIVKRS